MRRTLPYFPQPGDSARKIGGRRMLRDVVVGGGNSTIKGTAFNKVDPLNTGTVYQNFKGPFNLNRTYPHGEQLIVKFASPFFYGPGQDLYRNFLVTSGTDRMSYHNTSGVNISLPDFYVLADLIYEDFDPTTLTWANMPNSNRYIQSGDHTDEWSPLVSSVPVNIATLGPGSTSTPIPLDEILYAESQNEPDADLRAPFFLVGPIQGSLEAPEMSKASYDQIWQPFSSTVVSVNKTAKTFTLDFPFFGFFGNDDALNGWPFYVLNTTDPAKTRLGTIADYVGASQGVTYSMIDDSGLTEGCGILLFPRVYGMRLWTVQVGTFPTTNYVDGTWPGVEAVTAI